MVMNLIGVIHVEDIPVVNHTEHVSTERCVVDQVAVQNVKMEPHTVKEVHVMIQNVDQNVPSVTHVNHVLMELSTVMKHLLIGIHV